MACQNFVAGSENYLLLTLTNSVTNAAETGATVTASLFHQEDGTPVSGATAVSMPETATPGEYFGQFDDGIGITAGERLVYEITAESAAGGITRVFRGEIPVSE